jgi:UDP-N-acetylglucosamine acyltransferase
MSFSNSEFTEIGGNLFHNSSRVSKDAVLGSGNVFGPLVVIVAGTRIGSNNFFDTGVVVGSPPEVRDLLGPKAMLDWVPDNPVEIGSENTFREYVTVNSGIDRATRLGDAGYFQYAVHIGHDSRIAHNVTLSNSVSVGGHSNIHSFVNIGMGASLHQKSSIGFGCMIGMNTSVRGAIRPFTTENGNPAKKIGLNWPKLDFFELTGAQAVSLDFESLPEETELELSPLFNLAWKSDLEFFLQ